MKSQAGKESEGPSGLELEKKAGGRFY